jgi:hypothetical protein
LSVGKSTKTYGFFDRISVDEGIELVYLKSSNLLQVSFVLLQIEAGAGNVCFSITLLDQPIAMILGGGE